MTFFSPNDSWWLVAIMVAGTTLAIALEQRYRWAARLSGPVIALLIAMVLSNTRVVPADAPVYEFVNTWLLPLALPLLLLKADLRRMARVTGRLMVSFHIATLGTLLGAWGAGVLLRDTLPDSAKAAGIMAASYIGGMVNFIAVQESTAAPASMTTALVVADNLVMAGSFLVILWIVASPFFLARYAHPHSDEAAAAEAGAAPDAPSEAAGVTVLDVGVCLALATGMVAVAMAAKAGLEKAWVTAPSESWVWTMVRSLATNRFVLITVVSLAVATLGSRWLGRVRGADALGSYILYLFLFGIGLPADLTAVMKSGPALFILCALICAANIGSALVLGRWLRLPIEELMLGVNASLGGPPTAAAMAVSKGWTRLVLPGLLIGLWGYAIGTPLGLMITTILQRTAPGP